MPYLGEIRIFAGSFAPLGWAMCDGQQLPISENEPLFQLIGTTYGGNGEEWFALPDLRGRLPIHQANEFILGQTGGAEDVTLTVSQIPTHTHPMLASSAPAGESSPGAQVLGQSGSIDLFLVDAPSADLAANSVVLVGGSQPHTNFQPYLCVNFIISLFGVFPSPT
jgi:microcystin-dependent protein